MRCAPNFMNSEGILLHRNQERNLICVTFYRGADVIVHATGFTLQEWGLKPPASICESPLSVGVQISVPKSGKPS